MARFTGTLKLLALDRNSLRAVDELLKDILKDGAQEWVRTVSAIIPNWSGMARASIQSIGAVVDQPVQVGVDANAPDRRAEGARLGSAELISESNVYTFKYRSDVFHLAYNEFNDATRVGFHLRFPGPYHSQRQADEAFQRTIQSRLRSLGISKLVTNNIKVTTSRLG